MTLVVVERSFEEGTDFEALTAAEAAVAWCLDEHEVRALHSYMARDGRHVVCLYEAPDAESVRVTQRIGKLPFDHIWSAHHVDLGQREANEGASDYVMVQRELPGGVQPEAVEAMFEGARDCLQRMRATLVDSLLSLDGTRMVCRFRAPDTESVRASQRETGLPMLRAWPAKRIPPAQAGDPSAG